MYGLTQQIQVVEIEHCLSIGLCFLTLILLGRSVLLGRDQRNRLKRNRQLILSMGLLPLITVYFTDLTLVHYMKEDRFCESCHVMEPFVAGLKDPDNDGLAAAHAQHVRIRENHCSTCNSGDEAGNDNEESEDEV